MTAPLSPALLGDDEIRAAAAEFGTPVYCYDQSRLREAAEEALNFPYHGELLVRYAMKANSNKTILQFLHGMGIHIDASSTYEARRALAAGIPPEHILITAQELSDGLGELLGQGVQINASSLAQLRRIAGEFPGHRIGIRINPGLGSGGTNRTNTGGPSSSFGIWHTHLKEAREIAAGGALQVIRIHTHIGSGSDPAVWQTVAGKSIPLLDLFPAASILNLGGGYKVARCAEETETSFPVIGAPVSSLLEDYGKRTGRRIRLEIEPGTKLMAHAGVLITTVQDIADTRDSDGSGYRFLKLNAGMNDLLRPAIYGAQHPLRIVPADSSCEQAPPLPQVVVGHCCESGDSFTPAPGEPELLAPRMLPPASIGDLCVIGDAGAYCFSMCTANYNSFPRPAEIWRDEQGSLRLIRARQSVEQIWADETP